MKRVESDSPVNVLHMLKDLSFGGPQNLVLDMGDYLSKKIIDADPFQTLDQASVGKLVDMGIKGGRSTNPSIKCGVCGEHGGDPASVEFFNGLGVNYVSCSPFRVPIARLAAAQAAIKSYK